MLRIRRVSRVALVVALSLPFSPVSACDEIDPVDLIPGDGVCSGVFLNGDPQTAYSYGELTQIINGGAGLYDQYGFVAAAFQNYDVDISEPSAAATLSLFNQGTAENAEALYNDPESGAGDPIPDWEGSGAARVRFDVLSVTLQFHEECLFGSVFVYSSEDGAYEAARCLGETVCARIQVELSVRTESWGSLKTGFR